jgi:hypothetical protein
MNQFVIWEWSRDVKHAARLQDMINFDDAPSFVLGRPLQGTFPDNVQFQMDPDAPRDTVLTDFLVNINSLLVVSRRLKEFLAARAIKSVEYLPVTILNHKGKVASPDYFIVHTIDDIDCLDLAKSVPRYSQIRKEAINRVQKMVLDPALVDPARELFQVKNLDGFTFATRSLAEAMTKEKFTSIEWLPIEDYDPDA